MCTPILLWLAEQSRQRKIPYVTEAHVGRVLGQSKQVPFAPSFESLRKVLFLSAVGTHTLFLPAAVSWPLPCIWLPLRKLDMAKR